MEPEQLLHTSTLFPSFLMPWGCQGDCHTFMAPEIDLSKDREREREKHVAVATGA